MNNKLFGRNSHFVLAFLIASGTAQAVVDISDLPVYALQGVPPNIALTIDDSGSMKRAYVPDDLDTVGVRFRSKTYNGLYYDPAIVYRAPVDENGNALSTTYTQAWMNGFDQSRGSYDLSSEYQATTDYDPSSSSESRQGSEGHADYYLFDGSNAACDGDTANNDCYDRVDVNTLTASEKQNFANWYSFYRTRNLAVVSSATLAFSKLPDSVRVAWQNLHSCDGFDTSCQGWTSTSYDSRIAKFSGSHRQDFYNWLFREPADGNTPLLAAAKRTGEMFTTDRPYDHDPGVQTTPRYECRRNFSILMTDGRWNSGYATGIGDVDNTAKTLPDGEAYAPSSPYQKSNSDNNLADIAFKYWSEDLSSLPNSNILGHMPVGSDTTFVSGGSTATVTPYWNPRNDPATWQHLTTFTMGLGLDEYLNVSGIEWSGQTHSGAGYDALMSGAGSWPDTGEGIVPGNIYDLWHAAINSRGEFFSVNTPDDMVQAFQGIIADILDRVGSSSAVSINAPILSTDSLGFQANFNTADWVGNVRAFPFSDGSGSDTCNSQRKGAICDTPEWSAAEKLAAQNWDTGRSIITYKPSTSSGVSFRWNSLDASQQTALNSTDSLGSSRLDYIRGDSSNEGNSTTQFRTRKTLPNGNKHTLGDIVNSSPLFVGTPSLFLPESGFSGYAAFKTAQSNRQPVVYVGGNDGVLHAFNASSCTDSANCGKELFAYVPNAVYSNLKKLTASNFTHTSFVDGPLVSKDAYFSGSWHTVLVGTLGLGGNSVYALDITSPGSFSEANAANMALWEFQDPDLGTLQSKPIVTQLNNGVWAVIFNNGYNSASGVGYLYIVNLADGTLIKKIAVDNDTTLFPANGLSALADVDDNDDFKTDWVYGGDLYGNVWKFDVSSSDPNQWDVAYTSGSKPLPAFVAKDNNGNRLKITTAPVVNSHPTGEGHIVYFGTGIYLGFSDIYDTQTQTMYGIWVKEGNSHSLSITRDHLLNQEIVGVNTTAFSLSDARVTGNNKIYWHDENGLPLDANSNGKPDTHLGWYHDFNTEPGERVHQSPFIRGSTLVFVTVTPSDDPCSEGGTSWLYEIDALSGSRLPRTPFDYNFDGKFNDDDLVPINLDNDGLTPDEKVPGSAIRVKNGGVYYLDKNAVMTTDDGNEVKAVSTSTNKVISIGESGSSALPRSWVEILE